MYTDTTNTDVLDQALRLRERTASRLIGSANALLSLTGDELLPALKAIISLWKREIQSDNALAALLPSHKLTAMKRALSGE
jgi:hypothetical protein